MEVRNIFNKLVSLGKIIIIIKIRNNSVKSNLWFGNFSKVRNIIK